MSEIKAIYDSILEGDKDNTCKRIQAALENKVPAEKILHEGMIAAMQEVGRLFEEGEYFVPEMLVSARTMQAGLESIKHLLVESGVKMVGKVAIGTVKGDLHDIGKNLVGMMLEGSGFEVVDLGTDVNPAAFVEAVKDGADIVALSALLTTTMPAMKDTVEAIEAAGLRTKTKIIIGGAPVTAEYASQIGADGFSPDASQAATLAKSFMSS